MKKLLILIALVVPVLASAQDVILPERPARTGYVDYWLQDQGFWCAGQSLTSAVFIGAPQIAVSEQISAVAGYRLSEYIRFGLGVGVKKYINGYPVASTNLPEGLIMPIFFDARGSLLLQATARRLVPYWDFAAGYAVGEGAFASPSLGIRIGGLRHNLLLAVNYTLQQCKAPYLDYNESLTLNSFGIVVGYEF